MFPNRFYTEWLVNEMIKLNKKVRESSHKKDSTNNSTVLNYEEGYCKALVEVISDLREVLNYEEEEDE